MKLKDLRSNIREDFMHFTAGSFYKKKRKIKITDYISALFSPEFRVVLCYRILNFLIENNFKKVVFFLHARAKRKYSCDISPFAKIGGGLRVVHPFDVVVGPEVIMGSNIVMFNGVNLGNKSIHGKKNNMPVIGNHVLISTGVKILGDIVVGDDVTIGANSVVIRNCDSGGTYVGAPAKKIG